jgi:RimJ/RimL family protein N-acetyltransferase
MDRQPVLEGERLLLRPLELDDWEALYAVASDPEIWAMHPAHDRWREDVFREFFDDGLAKGGALAVIDKASEAMIGSSRFQNLREDDGGEVEIGWTFLARSHWGSGANTQMKRLMVGHALQYVERAIFAVGEENWRSRKALAKIGAEEVAGFREVREMAGGPAAHLRYQITRDSFANGPLSD